MAVIKLPMARCRQCYCAIFSLALSYKLITHDRSSTSTLENRKTPVPSFASAAVEDQDRLFNVAFNILTDAIANQAFPCASVAVTHSGSLVALKGFGRFTYDENSPLAD